LPVLTIIAGPNGSGKSTITRSVDFEGRIRLLDPDAVARDLNPADPSAAAIAAGREVLCRTEEYLRDGLSFAVETTLSSRNNVGLIRRAKERGFEIDIVYVALERAERNIARIQERIARGGHSVPDADVRRRYERSMANCPAAMLLADFGMIYDNSGAEFRMVLVVRRGRIVWRAAPLPAWLARLIPVIEAGYSTL
jgi:predicted ABC-type ATPase